ncbi:MAG TPA: hypothetical protein VN678_04945 [Acidobacteriaceae bacterium]|nr:hypothetical protein [Acidobacteriaceae bacterium]
MSICANNNRATKGYRLRLAATMATYLICLATTVRILGRHHPEGWVAYGLALLPALPVVGAIGVIGIYLTEEKDEYQRTVIVQSMLWALGLTMATLTVWGFLELFAGVAHFQTYLAFPLFWVMAAVVSPFVRMRYR